MEAGAKRTVSHFELTHQIIKAALAVHSELGPGLLESTYEACRIDLLVEDEIIVEIKSIEKVAPVHKAQLLSYLRLSKKRVGLLINFNVTHLKDGIHRVVNGPNLKIPSPYPET